MQCHEVDYQIFGDDMQIVEVELDPGEAVVAEAGMMNYMEEGIEFTAKMGDGSDPQQGFMKTIFAAAGRKLTGESLFLIGTQIFGLLFAPSGYLVAFYLGKPILDAARAGTARVR